MKDKVIIAAFLGLNFACAQSISLGSLIKTKSVDKSITIDPVPVRNNDSDVDDFLDYRAELEDDYLPCSGADNCGEAKSFQSETEFNNFINQYVGNQNIVGTVKNQVQPTIGTI